MKTTKNAFIKKAITAGMVVMMLIFSSAFVTKNNETKKGNAITFSKIDKISYEEPKYYVVIAWKRLAYDETKEVPCISNIIYVDCKYHSSSTVTSAFGTFYEAYYDTKGVKDSSALVFSTKDEAISERRGLIAEYRRDYSPTIISDFTVPCKDY
jgi:hypothetical protein